jgi:hypothetical protein
MMTSVRSAKPTARFAKITPLAMSVYLVFTTIPPPKTVRLALPFLTAKTALLMANAPPAPQRTITLATASAQCVQLIKTTAKIAQLLMSALPASPICTT